MSFREKFFTRQMSVLVTITSFFGIMAGGMVIINNLTIPQDVAFAQSQPNPPQGEAPTLIIPGDSQQTGNTNSPTAPQQNQDQIPPTPTPSNESIDTGTNQVQPAQNNPADPNQQALQAAQSAQDSTPRSGGLGFTIAGMFVILLGLGYYYYLNHANSKQALKMAEKRIPKVNKK